MLSALGRREEALTATQEAVTSTANWPNKTPRPSSPTWR
jgi:hypothetical protein